MTPKYNLTPDIIMKAPELLEELENELKCLLDIMASPEAIEALCSEKIFGPSYAVKCMERSTRLLALIAKAGGGK